MLSFLGLNWLRRALGNTMASDESWIVLDGKDMHRTGRNGAAAGADLDVTSSTYVEALQIRICAATRCRP